MSGSVTTIERSDPSEAPWSDRLGIPALVAATTISNLGNGITSLAIPWFVLVTTGSPARTGIAGALVVLANVMSSVIGGAAVDRLGHKQSSIISDLLSGITVAIIPTLHLLGVLEYWHLLALIFTGAIFDAPGSVARTALVPRLARRAKMPLERANSAMQFADQSSRSLLGPLAAGLLIGFVGAASVLYIDAATFILSIAIIGLLVRIPARAAASAGADGPTGLPATDDSFFESVREGFRYVLRDEFLLLIMPISLLLNFIFSPTVAVVLPVLARDVFDSSSALGLIIASFGAGSTIGTLFYGWKGHQFSRYWTFMVAMIGITFGFWLLAITTTVWLAAIALGLCGLVIGPTNVLALTIMQGRVPVEMLGRVFGLMFSFSAALAPLGVFLGGIFIELIGLRAVMVASAVGITIAMLRVIMVRDLVRQFDVDAEPDQEGAAADG